MCYLATQKSSMWIIQWVYRHLVDVWLPAAHGNMYYNGDNAWFRRGHSTGSSALVCLNLVVVKDGDCTPYPVWCINLNDEWW